MKLLRSNSVSTLSAALLLITPEGALDFEMGGGVRRKAPNPGSNELIWGKK